MNRISVVFQFNNRCDVVKSFLDTNHKYFYKDKKHSSEKYEDAIIALFRAVESSPYVVKEEVESACISFAVARNCNVIRDQVYAMLGQLLCCYVLDDMLGVDSIKASIRSMKIPKRVNPKGVVQNIGKGSVVATGLVISAIPPLRVTGYAITQYGQRIQTEDSLILDTEILNLISDISSLDYVTLHKQLQN